jgi:hypothetical protein
VSRPKSRIGISASQRVRILRLRLSAGPLFLCLRSSPKFSPPSAPSFHKVSSTWYACASARAKFTVTWFGYLVQTPAISSDVYAANSKRPLLFPAQHCTYPHNPLCKLYEFLGATNRCKQISYFRLLRFQSWMVQFFISRSRQI